MRTKPYIEEEDIQDLIFLDELHYEEENTIKLQLFEKYGKKLRHYRRINTNRDRKLRKFTPFNKLPF